MDIRQRRRRQKTATKSDCRSFKVSMKNRIYSSYEKQLGTEPSLKRSLDGIAIEFNRRKIIELHPDGTHVINTGGWRTPSVRAKIESAIEKLGFTIVQQKGHWYLEGNAERYVFEDGIT